MPSRRIMMAYIMSHQSRLPAEYQEVEYIESTGTQYINPNIVLDSTYSVEIDYQLTQQTQTRKGLFGILTSGANARYGSLLSPSNHYLEHGYGTNNAYWQQGLPDTNRHVLRQEKNKVYFDGILINTFNDVSFLTTGESYLGNFNYTNYTPALAKYYHSKWWANDTLVRDFIPCYRKADNEIGLYDLVNGVFYTNAGTGTFSKGSNV